MEAFVYGWVKHKGHTNMLVKQMTISTRFLSATFETPPKTSEEGSLGKPFNMLSSLQKSASAYQYHETAHGKDFTPFDFDLLRSLTSE